MRRAVIRTFVLGTAAALTAGLATAGAASAATPAGAVAMARHYVTDLGNRNYAHLWTYLPPSEQKKITQRQLISCETTHVAPLITVYRWEKVQAVKPATIAVPGTGKRAGKSVTGYVTIRESGKTYHHVPSAAIDAVYLSGKWRWVITASALKTCTSS